MYANIANYLKRRHLTNLYISGVPTSRTSEGWGELAGSGKRFNLDENKLAAKRNAEFHMPSRAR